MRSFAVLGKGGRKVFKGILMRNRQRENWQRENKQSENKQSENKQSELNKDDDLQMNRRWSSCKL